MPTVLIVEDEFLIRDLLKEELEDAGYQVVPVPDADHAIHVLETRQDIHLVFTDINMPGIYGRLEARRLRRRPMAAGPHHRHHGPSQAP